MLAVPCLVAMCSLTNSKIRLFLILKKWHYFIWGEKIFYWQNILVCLVYIFLMRSDHVLSCHTVMLQHAPQMLLPQQINNCSDSRTLFKTFSSLLCPPPPPPSSTHTADDVAKFFINKTRTISDQFSTSQTDKNFITTNTHSLSSFSPLSEADVSNLILSNHPTTCPLDPIPTHLQTISSSVIPALTHIINTSLHTGTFPTAFK